MRLPTEMTSGQIAKLVGGRVQGPDDVKVSSIALSPLEATEGQVAFIYDQKYLKRLPQCKASVGSFLKEPRLIDRSFL